MISASFNFLIEKIFLFCLLLLFGAASAQPILKLDWMHKEPVGLGLLIRKDSQKNVISCGRHGTNIFGNYTNLFITKYDSSGSIIWTQTKSDIMGGLLFPFDMVLDSADNIYVSGRAHDDPQNREGFLIKYDAQGTFLWLRFFGFSQGLSGFFNSMTIYDNKYITVGAYMDSTGGPHARAMLAQYSPSGNLNWYHLDTNNFLTRAHHITSDNYGNVYAAYATNCCPPATKASIAKFDTLGNELWQYPIADSTYHFMWPQKIATDDSSYVYLITQAVGSGTGSAYDCGIAKLDSNGNQKWFSIYRDFPYQGKDELPTNILFDKNNCYVYGYIDSLSLNAAGFIIKISKMGVIRWDYVYSPITTNKNAISGSSLISDSTIAIAGSGAILPNIGGIFLQLLDTSGNVKFNYQNPNYCGINGMINIDSIFYFVGDYHDTNEIEPDSSLTCRISFDFMNYVSEGLDDVGFTTYPNPFDEQININFVNQILDKVEITIYSVLGKRVLTSVNDLTLNTQALPGGIYFLELKYRDKIVRQKVVKN